MRFPTLSRLPSFPRLAALGLLAAALAPARAATCPGTPWAVLTPAGGEVYHVGDTMTISMCTSQPSDWPVDNTSARPDLWFSFNGKNFVEVQYILGPTAKWVIPDSIVNSAGSFSTVCDSCKIRIQDYNAGDQIRAVSAKTFRVLPRMSALRPRQGNAPMSVQGADGVNALGQSMGTKRGRGFPDYRWDPKSGKILVVH